jgi:prolipoprotein diacylglyceryltransferase
MAPAHLYALFMALALTVAVLLRRPSPLPLRERLGVYCGAIAGGAFGAKLPFILLGGAPLLELHSWLAEGKSILPGLAGGYLGVEAAKLALGVRAKTGDGFAVPLAAAIAVGRWGCFWNGCCSAPGHAVPIYESAFHAFMALVLWRLERAGALRLQRLKLYLIAYCVFRFAIEFIRVEPRVFLGLTAYQLGAAAFAALLALLWRRDERLKENGHTRLVLTGSTVE